ncbi:MAG: hypothetical protein PHP79_04195 [Clostridia bacterium]|nr:hypothetical protein [Clostridia bacterium]
MKNRIISLVLISAILFSMGGLSGCNKTGEKPAEKSVVLPEQITGMLTEENLSVSQDGVSFTVEEGAFRKDTEVIITRQTNLPPIIVEEEEITPTVYDFSVSGEEPMGVMELGIPCDASPEEVFAAYYNPESGEWEPVEFYYDADNKCSVISATHLSAYGVFTIKNENKRTAMLAFSNDLILNDMDLAKAIEMLEAAQNNPDTFYEDCFSLISQSISIQGGISTNLVDVMSGLSTSYVPAFSEGIKKSVTYLGYTMSGLEIINAFANDDKRTGVWKSVETVTGYVLDEVSSLIGTSSMAAGMFSMGVINYSLNEFITTALEGRADMYDKAYNLYYKEKGRKPADWVYLIRGMVEKGTDPEETGKAISAEIKRYVYEFWEDQTTVGEYGQDAKPGAWSAGSLGGLNDKIKREISEYNRTVIERIVSVILNRIQTENKIQLQTDIRKELLNLQKKMNSVVTISVTDSKAQKEPSHFAGVTLRFVDLPSRIEDSEKWQTVISDKGTGTIKFRVLAHILADSPRKMELVKKEGDTETVLIRFNAKFRVPESKLDLADLYPKSDFPKNIGGSYIVSMYNTTTQKTIDDLELTVNITKEVSDGCYADFHLENNGSVYLNGNYFYRYSTGKVNYAMGEMSFSNGGNDGVAFKFDAYDNQKKVWGSFTGQK